MSELSRERTLLMPRAFHYEVITTAPEKMYRTLVGLDEFRWVDKEVLLRSERDKGEQCSSLELPRSFVNQEILSPAWRPSSDEIKVAEQYKEESVDSFLKLWDVLIEFEPPGFTSIELVSTAGSEEEFIRLCEELQDKERIRTIAKEASFPHAEKLEKTWFTFRFIQAFGLQSLVLRRRYPNAKTEISRKRLEHDFHDMDYLALGLHVGSLATEDISPKLKKASIGWRYKLLEPMFQLVVPSDVMNPKSIFD